MIKEECGIVAVYNNPESAKLAMLGLHSLQHRGQESAGIVSSDGNKHYVYKDKGLVSEVFKENNLDQLIGEISIGHVRYSTTGSNRAINAQPIAINYKNGPLAIAHNGNFTNAISLKKELEKKGAIFTTSNDTEILTHLIAQHHGDNFLHSLKSSLVDLEGAFSLVALHKDKLIAVRDRYGIRPLFLGKIKKGYVVASESCAFDIIDAKFVREIKKGEMVIIDKDGVKTENIFPKTKGAFCIFEYIYIMRPDSLRGDEKKISSVYDIRVKLGKQLAKEFPIKADVVFGVPDSADPAALGFSEESGISLRKGLTRSHYIGRTFIEPEQKIRDYSARLKYNVVKSVVNKKKVVVIDDSIVRGTTSRRIVRMLKEAGAKEVHFLSTAPVWKNPCYYGVDTPDKESLIGNLGSIEKITKEIEADSVGYLSLEGLMKAVPCGSYCKACFDGDYIAGYPESFKKDTFEE